MNEESKDTDEEEDTDEENGSTLNFSNLTGGLFNNVKKKPRLQIFLKEPPVRIKKYNVEPFILNATKELQSQYLWDKLRPNGIYLGLVISEIIQGYVDIKYPFLKSETNEPKENKEPIKPILLHAFDPGICSELAETQVLYREMKPNNYPPLIIQGFSMY